MRTTTEVMFRARQVSNLGGFMSGVNNNGAHSANGITAMFIATGQDVGERRRVVGGVRVRRARPGHARLLLLGHDPVADRRDLRRWHRARHAARVPGDARLLRHWQGQQAGRDRRRRRCCAGELSLGSAVVAEEWVQAHDLLGRNRPDSVSPARHRGAGGLRKTQPRGAASPFSRRAGQPVEEAADRGVRLHARQVHADADVRPVRERQVQLRVLARDVEACRARRRRPGRGSRRRSRPRRSRRRRSRAPASSRSRVA